MNKKPNKLASEFDQKLNESRPAEPLSERDIRVEYSKEGDENDARRAETEAAHARDRSETIPVIEEQVHVDKKIVETGRVRISKDVHEEEVTVDLPTVYEEAHIERVAINEYVDTPPPPIRYEGDKMIIPVTREVLVVEKRILVVEELHVTKRRTEEHDSQQVKLRREEVNVNRFRNDDPERR
ncbi:YsnF/AvaK domain-containing protein [Pontibacter sp. HJ8]